MRTIVFLILATLLSGTVLDAQTFTDDHGLYHYWGTGLSGRNFAGDAHVDADGRVIAEQRFAANVSAEVLGFYWPLRDRHTIVGVVSNGAFDGEEMSKASFDLTEFTTSGSVMHFVTDTVGMGFMLRGDIGLAGRRATTADGDQVRTDLGLGMTLGMGYGFRAGGGNIIVGANVAVRRVGSQNYNSYGVTAGFLW